MGNPVSSGLAAACLLTVLPAVAVAAECRQPDFQVRLECFNREISALERKIEELSTALTAATAAIGAAPPVAPEPNNQIGFADFPANNGWGSNTATCPQGTYVSAIRGHTGPPIKIAVFCTAFRAVQP